ncbi:MAG: hypothetical protein LBI28_11665 [Treponema sp.]|jgi:hypothetical protein|nr:hypothetical protein [Treponema sp.]
MPYGKKFLVPLLLVLVTFGLGLFSFLYGINQSNMVKELTNSENKYLATIVEVSERRGKNLYINFQIKGEDTIYKGRANFAEYRNIISVGKEITVIFDRENKKYIIENFIVTYQRDYKLMLFFGILIIAITLIGTINFFIRGFFIQNNKNNKNNNCVSRNYQKIEYSFKKHIENEYVTYLLFLMFIILMALCIFLTTTATFIANGFFNINYFLGKLYDIIFMPIISFISLVLLLLRVYSTKQFLKNCLEINAKIEKYLCYYGKYSRGIEGTETAIRVIFSYTINGKNYTKGYSIAKNKNTREYFDLFKKQGENVKILVDNKNPKKIMVKEIFLY